MMQKRMKPNCITCGLPLVGFRAVMNQRHGSVEGCLVDLTDLAYEFAVVVEKKHPGEGIARLRDCLAHLEHLTTATHKGGVLNQWPR